jgi:hypothetical protein
MQFQHSHSFSASSFANVGIETPPATTGIVEPGFDIRFERLRRAGSEGQIRSTGYSRRTMLRPFSSCARH